MIYRHFSSTCTAIVSLRRTNTNPFPYPAGSHSSYTEFVFLPRKRKRKKSRIVFHFVYIFLCGQTSKLNKSYSFAVFLVVASCVYELLVSDGIVPFVLLE